jgi:hypothetical protein
MVQEDALKPVIELLNTLKISYMFVGAFAVNYYAVPRFTHDADLVIHIALEHIESLCKPLEKHFYIDRDMIKEALTTIGQFNIIHHESGFKIDFWTVKNDEISQAQFSRRIAGKIFGLDVYIITPEDLILTKLVWYKESGSQKHFIDAAGVFRMQNDTLATDYLENYAGKMGVENLLERIKNHPLETSP